MKIIDRIKQLYTTVLSSKAEINRIAQINFYKGLYLQSDNIGTTKNAIADREVIVSLTTYGNKIDQCYLAVESLLHQTLPPNKIILWLDSEKFQDENSIPLSLRKQIKRGLEISLVKDVRSHTKLVPALKQYPEAIIITIDDDIIYPIDFVERLVRSYQRDPTKIYFYRGHRMTFKNGNYFSPEPYLNWVKKGAKGDSILNVPTGVLGVLYPPHCMHPDVTDETKFLKLCPYADDIWFKVMSLLNGVSCEMIPTVHRENKFITLDIDETSSLQSQNVVGRKNDDQIKALFANYPISEKLMAI